MNTLMNMKSEPQTSSLTLKLAWAITLLTSLLPDILWREYVNANSGWLFWAKVVILVVLAVLTWLWRPLRPLRSFLAMWVVLLAAVQISARLSFSLPALQELLGAGAFVRKMQPEQFGKLAVALIVIAALLLLGYHRKQLFLTPGKLDAPITPVKWMGFPKPDPWWNFGGQYGFYIPLGMGVAAWLVSRPAPGLLERALPLLPGIVLFAAMNAFNEEMTYRASMLATLDGPVDMKHSWWMSALYFGLAHFYGVPYGWVGAALATFNGWLLGKAMLETRGLFWAWWMHFLQDIVIFIFVAAGAITPGG
jgi:hypothetical protein